MFAASATAGALLSRKDDEGIDRVPLDVPGLLLVAGGLFSLVFGFSHADTTAWRNPFTVGLLVAGVVLLAAFAYFETWAEYPLLPPRVVLLHGGSARDRVQLATLSVRLEASILSADQPG